MTDSKLANEHPDWDVYDDFTGVEPPRALRDPALPVTLYDMLVPLDHEEMYVPNHLDGDGTVHFFAAVEMSNQPDGNDLAYELRYFRAAQTDDGRLVHDAHPVMPLDSRGDTPFPRDTLEWMLMHDELDSAVDLAHLTAQAHGVAFPEPEALPPLHTGVDYRFETAINADGSPAIEAVKSWREGNQDQEARLTIASYGMRPELEVDLRELNDLRANEGLQAAMTLAESMAVASGTLDAERADPKLFTDGPPDPFTTQLEREATFIRDYGDEDTPRETPQYGIDAISANGLSHLNVSKTWGDDGHAHLIIPQPTWEEAVANAQAAHNLMLADNLEGAMTLLEIIGVEAGVIDPYRDDARLFTDGPPDPFTTTLERERAEAIFIRDYGDMDTEPLTPVTITPEESVRYSFELETVDPWTLELSAQKHWVTEDGEIRQDGQTLKSYSLESFEWEREIEREVAAIDHENLQRTFQDEGLEAAMHRAESMAVENGELDPSREDGRLFTDGPPDRFTTLREAELAGKTEPEPGSWEELLAQHFDAEPEPEPHYWQMHHRPVETPNGEKLGTALFVTEFPQLPPNFDDYIDENGMDDSVYPTEARTLEMAHFADDKEAERFEREFRSYLVPGVMDGPDLAPEVAKMEGLSGEWTEMDYRGIVDFMSGQRTIMRAESEWHLHDPHAEREAMDRLQQAHIEIDL